MFSLYLPLLFAGIVGTGLARDVGIHTGANAGDVSILSPQNHAVLANGRGIALVFEAPPIPGGRRLSIAVDGRAPIVVHDAGRCPCRVTLPRLAPGRHRLVVREAMAGRAPGGIESRVRFTIK
jgi:hypothetical protein